MEQTSMESSLQVILRQAASREQRPFIILGFLTGLGLSAVIGAVLYVYLTLGWRDEGMPSQPLWHCETARRRANCGRGRMAIAHRRMLPCGLRLVTIWL